MNTLNYYLDTEFAESRGKLSLISIGIACSDGRTFYAENCLFDPRDANDWVKENVLPKLKWHGKVDSGKGHMNISTDNKGCVEAYADPENIAAALCAFLRVGIHRVPIRPIEEGQMITGNVKIPTPVPIFYAYYGAYDWVALCWIFGTMMDLPTGMPMFFHDLKPMMDRTIALRDMPPLPDPENCHNALDDAIWNRELHRQIKTYNGQF